MKCLIVSGGEYSSYICDEHYDLTIAVDKGYIYSKQLGIQPDVLMGDFDSFCGTLPEGDSTMEVLKFPVEKDDTDTMLAIREAIKRGCDRATIICGLGGRVDHTLANIQSLVFGAQHGIHCEILSDRERIWVFTGGLAQIPRREGYNLSLLSLSDKCEGVTIKGAKYCCENMTISNAFPIGHGNSWMDETIILEMKDGILAVIEEFNDR